MNAVQIQRMVRAILQHGGASSTSGDAAGYVRPQPSPSFVQAEAATRPDAVRVSPDAQQQLADSVLRVLSDAAEAGPTATRGAPAGRALDAVLSDPGLRADLVRTFSQPDVAARMPEFLRDPNLQEAAVRLLAREEMRSVAQEVVHTPETARTFADLLSRQATREPALQVLARPESSDLARQTLARPETQAQLGEIIESASGRATIARAIAHEPVLRGALLEAMAQPTGAPADAPPRVSPQTGRPEASPAIRALGLPEARGALGEILNQPEAARPYLDILARSSEGARLAADMLRLPAVRDRVAQALASPETAQGALRLIAREELASQAVDILARADARAVLSATLEASPAQDASARQLLDILNRNADAPQATEALRQTLQDGGLARALADRMASEPAWQRTVLQTLSQPGIESEARAFLESNAAQQAISRMVGPRSGVAPVDRTALLQTLLSLDAADTLRTAIEAAGPRALLGAMLAEPASRATAAEILTRPEMAATASEFLTSAEGAQSIRTLSADPSAGAVLARLTAHPEAAPRILEALAAQESPEAAARVLQRPEVARRLAPLLENPQTARPLFQALAAMTQSGDGELTALAAHIATTRAAQQALPQALAEPATRLSALQILARPEIASETLQALGQGQAQRALGQAMASSAPAERSLALRILAQADSAELARTVLQQPSSPAAQAIQRALGDGAAPADRANALRILAHPGLEQIALRTLQEPDQLQAMTRWIGQPETRTTALEMIERPAMAPLLARALGQTETRQALLRDALTATDSREALRLLSASPRSAQALLEALAEPRNAAAAIRLMGADAVQAQATRLLAQEATRSPLLELLARPELAPRAAEILARPEAQTQVAELLSRPDSRSAVLPVLESLAGSPALRALASRADFARSLLAALGAEAGSAAQAIRVLRATASPEALAGIMQSPEWAAQAPRLLAQTESRAQVLALVASAPPEVDTSSWLSPPQQTQALREALTAITADIAHRPAAQAADALRILARPEMAPQAARIAADPAMRTVLADLLASSATRASAFDALANARQPQVMQEAFAGRGGELLALEIATSPSGRENAAAEMLARTQAAEALLRALSHPENARAAQETFNRQPAREQAIALLREGTDAARGALLRIMRQPQMAEAVRQIVQNPQTLSALPDLLSNGDTRAPLLQLLANGAEPGGALSQQILRPALARPESVEALAGLFRSNAASSPSTTTNAALRILAWPDMGQTAARVFATPESRNALAGILTQAVRLNEPPETAAASPEIAREGYRQAMRLLERPELAGAAHQLMADAQVRRQVGDLLAAAAGGRVADIDNALPVLRILSRPEMAEAARQVLSRADVASRIPTLLLDGRTRQPLLQALLQPELAEIARPVFESDAAQRTLAEVLGASSARARNTTLEILRSPGAARAALTAMETALRADALNRLLDRPAIRQELASLIGNSATAPQALRVLARSGHVEAAQAALQTAGARETLARTWETAPQQAARWLDFLARPEAEQLARDLFSRPETLDRIEHLLTGPDNSRRSAIRFLASSSGRDAAATILSRPAAQQALAQAAADPANAQLQSEALRVLAQPEVATALQSILTQQQAQAAIAIALAQDHNRQTLLALLSDRRQAANARVILESNEGRMMLQRLLRNSSGRQVAQLLGNREIATRLLALASDTEDAQALIEMLSRQAGRRQLANLIANAQTRDATLRLFAAPGGDTLAAAALAHTETQAALLPLLSQADARQALLGLAAARPQQAHQAAQAMLAQALAQPDTPEETIAFLRRIIAQTADAPRPGPARLARPTALGDPLARIEGARSDPAVAEILGTASERAFRNLPLTLQRLFGPMSPAAQNRPLASAKNLERLGGALERLHATSPRRATRALRALAVLSRIGGSNLETVLEQIGARLESIASRVALKGGLPPGAAEPALADTSQLTIRMPGLASDRLTAMALALARNGVEVSFVGRDAMGTPQIHIQLAELPLGSAERPTSQLPGLVQHANLSEAERQTLAQALTLDRPETQRAAWRRDDNGLPLRPAALEAEEVALARARESIRAERLGARAPVDNPTALRPEVAAATTYAFNYALAALFPWFHFAQPPSAAAQAAGMVAPDGQIIPTMLDLVEMEPLLLGYEPDELMVPGTDIPLILPRQG